MLSATNRACCHFWCMPTTHLAAWCLTCCVAPCCNVQQANQVWWVYDRWCERSRGKPQHPQDLQLDVAAMQEAASHLLGSHDFSTFQDNRRPSGKALLVFAAPVSGVRLTKHNHVMVRRSLNDRCAVGLSCRRLRATDAEMPLTHRQT